MVNSMQGQGGTATVPPLPKMEQGTPGTTAKPAPPTKEQIRETARRSVEGVVAGAVGGADQPKVAIEGNSGIPDMSHIIPPQAVDISLAFFFTVAFIIVGWPLARAFARRIDRKSENMQVKGANIEPQLRQLQESIDAMAIEIERISEGQRFTSKLIAERKQ
jgi:hypothetical protein